MVIGACTRLAPTREIMEAGVGMHVKLMAKLAQLAGPLWHGLQRT
jgi:hypothetical protein